MRTIFLVTTNTTPGPPFAGEDYISMNQKTTLKNYNRTWITLCGTHRMSSWAGAPAVTVVISPCMVCYYTEQG